MGSSGVHVCAAACIPHTGAGEEPRQRQVSTSLATGRSCVRLPRPNRTASALRSKGDIAPDLVASEQALRYASAGCNVVSVLTEPHWFKGSLADLAAVREALGAAGHWPRVAVLRKDFIVDEYQLLEARAHGADTALLIVAVLSAHELAHLIAAARALGFEPLVEVNTPAEMEAAMAAGALVIGVNNRNLHTFVVDMSTTARLGRMLPPGGSAVLVSLSGVSKAEDVAPALEGGAVGVLVGEALMRATEPAQLIAQLRAAGQAARGTAAPAPLGSRPLVKVCGLKTAEAALCACESGADLLGLIFAQGSKRRVSAEAAAAIAAAVRRRRASASASGGKEPQLPPLPSAHAGGDAAQWFTAGAAWVESAVAALGRPLLVGVFQDQASAPLLPPFLPPGTRPPVPLMHLSFACLHLSA